MVRNRSNLGYFFLTKLPLEAIDMVNLLSAPAVEDDRVSNNPTVLPLTRVRLYKKLLFLSATRAYYFFESWLSHSTRMLNRHKKFLFALSTVSFLSYPALQKSAQYLLVGSTRSLLVARCLNLTLWSCNFYHTRRFFFTNAEWMFGTMGKQTRLWLFNIWSLSWRFKYFRTANQPLNYWLRGSVASPRTNPLQFNDNEILKPCFFLHGSLQATSNSHVYTLSNLLQSTDQTHFVGLQTNLQQPRLAHTSNITRTSWYRTSTSPIQSITLITTGTLFRLLLFICKQVYIVLMFMTLFRIRP